MDGNRVGAEVQLLGDLFVGISIADELQDLELARAQPVTPFALERRRWRHLGVEHHLTGQHAFDGRRQIQIQRALENVSAGSSLERLADQCVLGVHAEHQDRGFRESFEDLSRSHETARTGHRTVHHDHARP